MYMYVHFALRRRLARCASQVALCSSIINSDSQRRSRGSTFYFEIANKWRTVRTAAGISDRIFRPMCWSL